MTLIQIALPYQILAAAALAAALFGGGFASGHSWSTTKAEAKRAKDRDAYLEQIESQRKRADTLSEQLAQAEGRIVVKTVEVIKHVPSVTTGRLCLDAGAVGLLQPGAHPQPDPAPGKPAAESPPAAAASDRDVAYWIAEANRQYETCAGRMNALVDWHLGLSAE